jgi:hypothetical protein
VDRNYQPVYRTILEQSRECFQGSHLFGVQEVVQGDIYSDIQRGNVSVAQHNPMFGVNTYLAIDISALNDNATKVEAYYAFEAWKPMANAVEQWDKNDFKGCRFPE